MARRASGSCGYSGRKIDTREKRQRFLIVCGGKETETNYFESFRLPGMVKGFGVNPSQLVDKAAELAQKDDYDQVWCVFDRDDFPADDFNNAIKIAESKKYKVAYSNQAFELWYVLHFEFLNSAIPRNDYCKKLNHLLKCEYKKNSEDIYDQLLSRQNTAIKHSENLLKQYNPFNPAKDDPSTTVHLLVKELNRFIR
uniref:Abortive phage resistance protein n=1 Tax=Cyanothece sp. (strain PCC 7425 / ATCC 29141) TaxID=395961 RepID=B8HV58_CYAP4